MRDDIDAEERVAAREVRSRAGQPTARRASTTRSPTTSSRSSTAKSDDVTLEVGAHKIKLTQPRPRLLARGSALQQPAITKRDLIRYLAQVSPYMLPHLADRPLTMIRMPDGIDGQRFFQKHWEQERPTSSRRSPCSRSTRTSSTTTCSCNNLPTLLWLGADRHARVPRLAFARQLGAGRARRKHRLRELARSRSRLRCSTIPDYLVFDIDPYIYSGKEAKGAEPELNTSAFEKGKEVAFWLRDLLHGCRSTRS